VLADVVERDRRDSERAVAPMKPAEGVVVIDTSALDIEAAVARASQFIRAAIKT
jgi:cytidylate kinase